MGRFIDLAEHVFGRLTVVSREMERRTNGAGVYWRCRCTCGNIATVASSHLRGGRIISCGCFQKETAGTTGKRNAKPWSCGHSWTASGGAKGLCGRCYRHKRRKKGLDVEALRRSTLKRRESGAIRDYYLKNKYGITSIQYNNMLIQQNHVCAICGNSPKTRRLNVDHDHTTGRVRGLLCFWCNKYLLAARATVPIFRKAIMYLTNTFDGRHL